MIRLGLCCIFKEHPVKFRRTTATYLSKLSSEKQRARLSELCLINADSLMQSLEYCYKNGIGDFRINSQILPLKTHPDVGYAISDLPEAETIITAYQACGTFAQKHAIRTTFHPDQFIVLSSPNPDVVKRSVADLEYHAEIAELVNADVINLHAGGVYGDKPSALNRLRRVIDTLSDPVRKRLTLENDDKSYSPEDLIPFCMEMKIPLVYDVHHHRCLKDRYRTQEATDLSVKTWNREPLFHISSPLNGWDSKDIRKHHDYINPDDFPDSWRKMDLTIEVEAKAKELAILKLMQDLHLK